MDILHAMAIALLEYETLDKDDIDLLMKRVKLPPKAMKVVNDGSSNMGGSGTAPATNEGMISGTSATPAAVWTHS